MKLQISFNLLDLDDAIKKASQVKNYCDVFEIGSLLIVHYGVKAVEKFRKKFPEKVLISGTKIIDHEKEIFGLFAEANSDWVTVLAGASPNVIHSACNSARNFGKKVLLDLIDASSPGQTALEAKTLGADALLFHKPTDATSKDIFLDLWDMVRGNTSLPIYISAHVTRENIKELIEIDPAGIVIEHAITQSKDPKTEAAYFYEIIQAKNKSA